MNAHPRIATYQCPCCGGFIGEAAPIDEVKKAVTSPSRRCILDILSEEIGRHRTRREIVAALLENGHCRTTMVSPKTVHVQVCNLRKQIEPFGWTVANSTAVPHAAQYRLIPLEAGQ